MSPGHQTAPRRSADRGHVVVVEDHALVRQVVNVRGLDLRAVKSYIVPTLDTQFGEVTLRCDTAL